VPLKWAITQQMRPAFFGLKRRVEEIWLSGGGALLPPNEQPMQLRDEMRQCFIWCGQLDFD
jgi:hypothetical protein